MLRVIPVTAAIALIGLFTLGAPNSYACQNQASVSAYTDDYLPVESTYDPCDYVVHWKFSLTRNYNHMGTEVNVKFEIIGALVTQPFYSGDFDDGETKTRAGDKWIGSSSSNTVKISKISGVSAKFTDLSAEVWYDNTTPTKPSEP